MLHKRRGKAPIYNGMKFLVSPLIDLSEIMVEHDINIVQLGKEINADPSTLHRWFDSVRDVKLKTLIKLANYFECSLEYLCGKTHEYIKCKPRPFCKFGIRIKEIIAEYKVTKNFF